MTVPVNSKLLLVGLSLSVKAINQLSLLCVAHLFLSGLNLTFSFVYGLLLSFRKLKFDVIRFVFSFIVSSFSAQRKLLYPRSGGSLLILS